MEQEQQIKKTRKPRSEESKQAQREKMLAYREKLRQENDGKAASPETVAKLKAPRAKQTEEGKMKRRNSGKAAALVLELLDMMNNLHCAQASPEVLTALQESFPDNQFHLSANGTQINFSRSVKDIREKYGAVGLEIWRKVFACIQQGGLSAEKVPFNSVWALNSKDWDMFTIRKIKLSKNGAATVTAFMKAIQFNEEYKRVGTRLKVEEIKGVKQIQASAKKMTTKAERKELAEKREALKVKHDIQSAPRGRVLPKLELVAA